MTHLSLQAGWLCYQNAETTLICHALEPSTQTELETALKQCNTQLQAVLKVKEGLVVMMRSYEKSADEKSAKILGPQIAEKEQVREILLYLYLSNRDTIFL